MTAKICTVIYTIIIEMSVINIILIKQKDTPYYISKEVPFGVLNKNFDNFIFIIITKDS